MYITEHDLPSHLRELARQRPYIDTSEVSPPNSMFIGWIDIMGMENLMLVRSMWEIANFIGKLNSAVLKAPRDAGVSSYPVVDGVYVVAGSADKVTEVMRFALRQCVLTFLFERDPIHKFLVRASLSHGEVIEGRDLMTPSHWVLNENPEHASSILFGSGFAEAHNYETRAAPFSLVVGPAALEAGAAGGEQLSGRSYVPWWDAGVELHEIMRRELGRCMGEYYDWCEEHSNESCYPEEAIGRHSRLLTRYLRL